MSYIVANKKNKTVLGTYNGSDDAGTELVLNPPNRGRRGVSDQLWTFESTPIPGVFYIVTTLRSGYVITIPPDATDGSHPTIEQKQDGYQPQQLWKFITSGDNTNFMIQNYSEDSSLVLDTSNVSGPGQVMTMWARLDNDNQKFYIHVKN